MLYHIPFHWVSWTEIHEMDIISRNKTITKELKQTKTKTFFGGSEKNCFEWLHKEPPKKN